MSKLSKRELVLIYILLLVVILVGGVYFLLRPTIEKSGELSTKVEELKFQKTTMKSTIASRKTMEKDAEEYKKKIETMKGKFQPMMENEEIDELITGMINGAGLTPQSLTIATGYSDITAYNGINNIKETLEGGSAGGSESAGGTENVGQDPQSSGTEGNATTEDQAEAAESAGETGTPNQTEGTEGIEGTTDEGGASTEAVEEDITDSGANVKVSVVTITARGGVVPLIAFLDATYNEKGIRVTAFSISEGGEENASLLEGLVGSGRSGGMNVEVTLEVYQNSEM